MKKTVSFLLILVLLLSCLPLDTLATETASTDTETASVEESIAAIREETAPAETSEATIVVEETVTETIPVETTANNEFLGTTSNPVILEMDTETLEQPQRGVDSSFLAPIDQITDEDAIPEGYTPIYNEVDLNNIKNNLSGKYILMRDIELKYTTSLNYKSSPFTGVLDGNGHTISGLTETEWYGPTMYWGLFGSISGAEISNLKITGTFDVKIGSMGYTECEFYLGGLTGEAIGAIRITNCVNDITFNCKAEYNDYLQVYLGGLIGKYRGSSGVIKDCRNIAEIACVENTGGLVGYADCSGEFGIVNCRNDANITCTKEVSPDDISGLGGPFGGIVGYVGGKRASVYISSCMNTGNVVHYDGNFPPAGSCGGIVGNGGAATISSCANTGKISGLLYVGGIAGDLSDSAMVQDCLNTGAVRINNAQYYGGGIAGGGGRFYRCLNTGMVTTPVVQGKAYNSGIVAKPGSSTLEEAEAAVVDCYWLDDGQTNTLYSRYSYDFGETKAIRTRGALSMRQMTEMESFQNFGFPDIWVMDEKLGHPRPTGMVIVTLENAYQAAYIEKMKISLENYEKIISASGYGSLAATLGNAYEKANLDKVNGAWDVMQIAEGWANYSSTELGDYDLLLADLLVGVIGRDTRDKHITSNVLNNISELITEAGAGLSATEILATEQYLKDMAAVPTVFGSAASKLVSGVRSTALKNVPYKKLGDCMNILGGLVSISDAAAAGCETVQDAFDFYVLCNAYADMVTTYGDVIHSAASRVLTIDSVEEDEAGELFQRTDEFVALMHQNLNKDVESLCKATENSVANLMVAGGCTIVEGVLNITELNPVLSVLNYIFSGVKLGVTIGMPIADSLTQMDDLAYYGRMIQMCGTFSKGLFVEVQDRMAAFQEDPTYEKAQAMELASDLYARLQILACDYGIGYYTALISSNLSEWLNLNQGKDVEAMAMLQSYQNALQEAIDSGKPVYIGQDGSVYGFIANCPVTIVITDAEGKEIARLKTGEITTDEDYAGNYLLLGENGEHKAGMYDPSKHTVTLIGETEGAMDLIAYCVKDGTLSCLDSYLDVSIDNGYTAKLEVDENGQFHLIQESEEAILWGDASGDGRVNAMDATRILRYAAKLIKEDKIDLIAADVNSDGRVNAMDATRILRYAAKLIPELKVQK